MVVGAIWAGMSRERRTNDIPPIQRIAVRREDAAALLSISTSHLDKMVADGVLPEPTQLGSVPLWDVAKLLAAWKRLVGDGGGDDIWSRAAL